MDIDYYLVSAARRAHRLRPERSYIMGREAGVDLHLQDALISRKHAELRFVPDNGWVFVDLGSRNGSIINGEQVQGTRVLADQDRIQVGGHVFVFHMLPPGGDIGAVSSQAPQIDDDATMGPGVSAGEIFTAGAAFTGQVSDGGVLDLLQFLMMTRKTGRLDILRGNSLVGSVHVKDGQVQQAACKGASGLDGLVALAKEVGESFAFHSEADVPAENHIGLSGDGVLMELARQLDEH